MNVCVWLIDEYHAEIERAIEVLDEIQKEQGCTIEREFNLEFHWPIFESTRPDILILDIDNHSRLDGIDVYKKIEREREVPGVPITKFVIVWSNVTGDEQTFEFFYEKIKFDSNLIICNVKSQIHLKQAVNGCINRIKEEY